MRAYNACSTEHSITARTRMRHNTGSRLIAQRSTAISRQLINLGRKLSCRPGRPLQQIPGQLLRAMKQTELAKPKTDTDLESAKPLNSNSTNSRLFSNLSTGSLKHEPGSVLGAAALVTGTTVGAGILALPYSTQEAGFVASSGALVAACCYSIITGLLVAEVNINTMCELGSGGCSLVSMAERTMGKLGTRVASATYLFLHYALLVAYISRAGEIVGGAMGLPQWLASLAFVAAFGGMCYASSPKLLDGINSALVALVVTSFGGLLLATASGIDPSHLLRADWAAVPATLPVLALAFVYQNVVPVISSQLEGDPVKVRTAIVAGSLAPLAMFLAWDAAILGSLGDNAVVGQDPLALLATGHPVVGLLIQAFSLLAILTSFIGFVLGLSDFIGDGLKLPSGRKQAVPYLLTVLPPTAFALSYPDLFFKSLDVAGTYGVLTLFGILPCAMVWSERYKGTTLSQVRIMPGGKPVLLGIAGVSAAIILHELAETLLPHAT